MSQSKIQPQAQVSEAERALLDGTSTIFLTFDGETFYEIHATHEVVKRSKVEGIARVMARAGKSVHLLRVIPE